MAIVGGNLADIAENVARLRETGASAVTSGESTKGAVDALQEAITSSTAQLMSRFESIAGDLKGQINTAARQLEAADWQGNSREQALAIKGNLAGQVDRVLATATSSLEADSTAFRARADALVSDIETQFRRVMIEVETQYVQLSQAAETTRSRFEAADQTIRMG